MEKLNIGIVLGSTREGRLSDQVGQWVKEIADKKGDANYTVLDIADYQLPLLGEAGKDASGAAKWSEDISKQDGFIFIVQEYNHSVTGALKNALDYLNPELNNKSAGIVSYGSVGGTRASEHLRGILAVLQVADVEKHVTFSTFSEFTDGVFTPKDTKEEHLEVLLNQVNTWAKALKTIR